ISRSILHFSHEFSARRGVPRGIAEMGLSPVAQSKSAALGGVALFGVFALIGYFVVKNKRARDNKVCYSSIFN
ncbi:hypothetical protein PMAYCL1PPCAC_25303, partial [Pristionchus mayeri]